MCKNTHSLHVQFTFGTVYWTRLLLLLLYDTSKSRLDKFWLDQPNLIGKHISPEPATDHLNVKVWLIEFA